MRYPDSQCYNSMKKFLYFGIVFCLSCFASIAEAAITSTTLTPASPTTLSNGRAYYCAGVPYTFRIQSTDPLATGAAYWQSAATPPPHTINVVFPGGSSFYVDLPGGGYSGTNLTVDTVTDNSGGTYTNIDYTVVVRFHWNTTAVAAGANSIVATVTADNGATTGTSTRNFNFGIITQIQALNFVQDGDAADGMVNPWHDGFNLTGRVVYYYPGEILSTPVEQVDPGEISSVQLWRQLLPAAAVNSGVVNSGTNSNFIFTIPGLPTPYFSSLGLGTHTWSVRAIMNTPTAGSTSVTAGGTLNIISDRIQVDAGGLTFVNGGGVNSPPQLYNVRSVNVAGTEMRLSARMQNSGSAMAGTVTFVIQDGLGNSYTLQMANGATTGTVLLGPTPTAAQVPAGNNTDVSYTVQSVSGGAYGNIITANGQNVPGRILNSSGYACRWENGHWPGYGSTPFTAEAAVPTSTATSFRLQWTALSAAAAAPYDADFYSYRVYFKRQADTAWLMLDGSNTPALGVIGAGTIAFDVGGVANPLEPLTPYDYRVSAIDVFGNEVPLASQISGNVTTSALTVEATVTDGISIFNNNSFGVPTVDPPPTNPLSHIVRKTAIKVTVYLVTAGTAPEQVNIVIANNDSDLPGQFGTGTVDDIVDNVAPGHLVDGVSRWTIPCTKVTANTYEALIPSEHTLMALETNIRFIVDSVVGGVHNYYDHTPDTAPPGSWTADEWRFRVAQPVLFIPFPTRILNNVLTAQMPCCYPAFFLAVDSLVTIRVYDVKGRIIATLCENLYRPGGQNIKDLGWCGRNKNNNRAGPGLYYIHIKAVTFGNRTVLDKKMKVVVRH